MNVLGVILARAGSAGLPQKHLKPLCGQAVIEYTFDHAAAARRISRTVVSTDCDGVKRLARRRQLQVIDRPRGLATAEASVQDVMLHALHSVEAAEDWRADALVVLYGNVPLRGEGVIDRAIELLAASGCDSVRSFCPVGKWHPAWMWTLNENQPTPLQQGSIHRRQDLTPLYLHDGAVVAVSRKSMLRGLENPQNPHAFFGDNYRAVRTEFGETVEIDHPRDLYLAEAILREKSISRLAEGKAA